jgi:hypothetical protein
MEKQADLAGRTGSLSRRGFKRAAADGNFLARAGNVSKTSVRGIRSVHEASETFRGRLANQFVENDCGDSRCDAKHFAVSACDCFAVQSQFVWTKNSNSVSANSVSAKSVFRLRWFSGQPPTKAAASGEAAAGKFF